MKKVIILLIFLSSFSVYCKGIKMIWITDSISTVQVEQSIKNISKQFKTNEMMIYFFAIDTVLMNSIDSTLLKDNYAMFQYSIVCTEKNKNTWISIFVGSKLFSQKQIEGFNPFKKFNIKKTFYKVKEFEPFGTNKFVHLDLFDEMETVLYYNKTFITYVEELKINQVMIKNYFDDTIDEETKLIRKNFFKEFKRLIKEEVLRKQLHQDKVIWKEVEDNK